MLDDVNHGLGQEDLERIYRGLRYVRRVEERIAEIYPSDKIKSPVHLSIGQEAVSVAVCDVLRSRDYVSAPYRGHAAYLARGGDLRGMMAELYGKVTGCARGKAGSMHLIDMPRRILGCSAVVGTTVPIALGFALAEKRRGGKGLVAAFCGDGATEEGCFAESLNFAALHKLPMLFIVENNGFAIHQPLSKRQATNKLVERVATYDIPAKRVADGDVLSIRAAAAKAVAHIRCTGGPAFIECLTYRWREHVGPGEDYDAGYRPRAELDAWIDNDQVAVMGGRLPTARRQAIDRAIEAEIADAVTFAEDSPFPDASELMDHVFAD